MMGSDRAVLAKQIASGDTGGRHRATADNRGLQKAFFLFFFFFFLRKKTPYIITIPYLPSYGTIREPYRISSIDAK